MSTSGEKHVSPFDPLEKARQVSQALADAARVARTTTRRRGGYSEGGLRTRRSDRIFSFWRSLTFLLCVVLPGLAIGVYYGVVASDQYVAETRFSVGTSMMPQTDKFGAVTGLVAASIVQDTQIVTSYVASRAAVEAIGKRLNLAKLYSDASIDYFSRFDSTEPIEAFVRHWQSMVSTSITLPSGYVTLKVRAFTAEDAVRVSQEVMRASEELVNDLNTRAFEDSMRTARAELDRATERLTKARLAIETARNTEGILDATKAGEAINTLIGEAKSGLLLLQQEYASKRRMVSENSPQMKVMKERIDATARQISELEGRLTRTKMTLDDGSTISASMSRFAELDLEKQIAERLYAGAIASVELARVAADQRRIYLNEFVQPALPERPQLPRRLLWGSLWIGGLLALWGGVWAMLGVARDYMA